MFHAEYKDTGITLTEAILVSFLLPPLMIFLLIGVFYHRHDTLLSGVGFTTGTT